MPAAPRKRPAAAPGAPSPPASPAAGTPAARGPLVYAAVSVLALVPCFWQSRIQAGDLSSHIYNAWLAQLIAQGQAPGLSIVPQTTNVLFDLLLSGLLRAFGAGAAQHIAVSLAVLVLVWGAFAFCAVAGRKPWSLLPAIVALAYGWVFHMGFFNFYLSLGLCLWALALAWETRPRRLAGAACLLALAFVAHGLPVAWAAAVLAYLWLLRRWPQYRRHFFLAAVAAMILTHVLLSVSMWTMWRWQQIGFAAGVRELWVYGDKFRLAAAGAALVFALLGLSLVRRIGARSLLSSDVFQVCALTSAGVLILPNAAWIPGYLHPLVFISQRMGLALAICICALLSSAPARRWHTALLTGFALLFFGFLYVDERALNALEDEEAALVATLPPGQRVIGGVEAPDVEVIALAHLVDRACIGRCFSYSNYEPPSGQFRIRVTGEQAIVAANDKASSEMQMGTYVVRPRDLPLYQFVPHDGRLALRSLPAGAQNGLALWEGLSGPGSSKIYLSPTAP